MFKKVSAVFIIHLIFLSLWGNNLVIGVEMSNKTVLFQDDFEAEKHVVGSMPAAPWESVAHSSATLTVEQVNSNKKVAFSINNRTGTVSRTLKLPLTTPIQKKVMIKATIQVPESNVQRYISIRDNSNNTSQKIVEFSSTGNILAGSAGLGTYLFGVDYIFMFELDLSSMVYDVYMNDMITPVAINRSIADSMTQIDQVEFSLYSASVSELSSVTYLDDVEVVSISPTQIFTYPMHQEKNVQVGTDMVVKANVDFDLSTLNTSTITDNEFGIIEAIQTDITNPKSFTVQLNDTVQYDTEYTISFNGIKTANGESIPPSYYTFTTEKKQNYWFSENWQSTSHQPENAPSDWTTTISGSGLAKIVEHTETINNNYYISQTGVGNVRSNKTFADGAKELNSVDKVMIMCNVLLDESSVTGVNKQIRLLTAGKAPMGLINFKTLYGEKYVSLYNLATELGSVKLSNTQDWLEVQIMLDTRTRSVTATINGIKIDSIGTYADNLTHVNGIDLYTVSANVDRYDGFYVDNIKVYGFDDMVVVDEMRFLQNQVEIFELIPGEITFDALVTNSSSLGKDISAYLVMYDENGILAKVNVQNAHVSGGSTIEVNLLHQLDEVIPNSKLKAFIWDSSNINPLTAEYELAPPNTPPLAQDGVNYALMATATASTHTQDNYYPYRVNDGIKNDNNSRWCSLSGDSQWLQLDWANPVKIGNVKVWTGNLQGRNYQIAAYDVQYWNGSQWITVANVSDNTADAFYGQYNNFTFSPVITSKIRLNITDACGLENDKYARVLEFEVYTKDNLVHMATATSSTINSSFSATKAIDFIKDSNNDRWLSGSGDSQWLQLTWNEPVTVGNIKVWSGNIDSQGYQLGAYTIQYLDYNDWNTITSISDNVQDGYNGECNDIVFEPVQTKAIRINISDASVYANYLFASILEVEIYSEGEVQVDSTKTHQTIDGWGGNIYPQAVLALANADTNYFSKMFDELSTDTLRIRSYWYQLEQYNDNEDAGSIDWTNMTTGDVTGSDIHNELLALREFSQRGIRLWFSSWRFPNWMLGESPDYVQEGQKTLPSGMDDEYVESLAGYLLYAKNMYGVEYDFISVANEPFYGGVYIGGMDAQRYYSITQKLKQKLLENNYSAQFVAAEANSATIDASNKTKAYFDADVNHDVYDVLSFHAYHKSNTGLNGFYRTAKQLGIKVYVSEQEVVTSTNTEEKYSWQHAINNAVGLHDVLTYGKASMTLHFAYSSLAASSGGLVIYDAMNKAWTPTYDMLKHFYNRVPIGSKMIDLSPTFANNNDVYMLGFLKPNQKLEFILINKSQTDTHTISVMAGEKNFSVTKSNAYMRNVKQGNILQSDDLNGMQISLEPQTILSLSQQ